MNVDEIIESESELVTDVKKNCRFCMGRHHLNRPRNPEREEVQKSLKELYGVYEKKFDALRKEDAPGTAVQNSLGNKRFILDVLDECKSCDMEMDRANRAMAQLK
ncbi:MAG: hypothetical protein NUV67_04945 [archaeon]|nr:hypothetical protein [archaeon]